MDACCRLERDSHYESEDSHHASLWFDLLSLERCGPEVNGVFNIIFFRYHLHDLVRLDTRHIELMGDNARAGPEFLELPNKLPIQLGPELERYHAFLAQV